MGFVVKSRVGKVKEFIRNSPFIIQMLSKVEERVYERAASDPISFARHVCTDAKHITSDLMKTCYQHILSGKGAGGIAVLNGRNEYFVVVASMEKISSKSRDKVVMTINSKTVENLGEGRDVAGKYKKAFETGKMDPDAIKGFLQSPDASAVIELEGSFEI